eukprot:1159478-Pelagomonas_calceolata.AAC.4
MDFNSSKDAKSQIWDICAATPCMHHSHAFHTVPQHHCHHPITPSKSSSSAAALCTKSRSCIPYCAPT